MMHFNVHIYRLLSVHMYMLHFTVYIYMLHFTLNTKMLHVTVHVNMLHLRHPLHAMKDLLAHIQLIWSHLVIWSHLRLPLNDVESRLYYSVGKVIPGSPTVYVQ